MEGLFSIAAFAKPWSGSSLPWTRKIFSPSSSPTNRGRSAGRCERRTRSLPRSALVSLPKILTRLAPWMIALSHCTFMCLDSNVV